MLARVTTLRFLADRAEEAFEVVANSIVPTIKEQHGCRGVLLLRAPNGDATTVTLWETEAAMAASATGNCPTQVAKLDGMLRESTSRETYNVLERAPRRERRHHSFVSLFHDAALDEHDSTSLAGHEASLTGQPELASSISRNRVVHRLGPT